MTGLRVKGAYQAYEDDKQFSHNRRFLQLKLTKRDKLFQYHIAFRGYFPHAHVAYILKNMNAAYTR